MDYFHYFCKKYVENMKQTILFSCLGAVVMLTACKQHYTLTDISRSRIVVDSRYDRQPDAAAAAFLAPYTQKVDSVMGPVLGEAARDMAAVRPESDLSNLLPDILVHMSKRYNETPDFAIYNIGGIRAALTKGKVTYGDVLAVAPFENKICFLSLTGEQVMELFRQIAHRGGEGVSRGVKLVITADGKLVSAQLHGKPVDPQTTYRIATIDYLSQGNDGLTAFKQCTDLNAPKDDANNTRYLIADYFREMQAKGQVVDAQVEGRIVVNN
jgi:2',3'-cyclic-nucleotide 2'-phosphodiesterase (5'-nucleotidase family)